MGSVKTTLEVPDDLFREAKATAARKGQSLKSFVTEALLAKLAMKQSPADKPWMKGFGALKHLRKENNRIEKIIEKEFETIDPEAWK